MRTFLVALVTILSSAILPGAASADGSVWFVAPADFPNTLTEALSVELRLRGRRLTQSSATAEASTYIWLSRGATCEQCWHVRMVVDGRQSRATHLASRVTPRSFAITTAGLLDPLPVLTPPRPLTPAPLPVEVDSAGDGHRPPQAPLRLASAPRPRPRAIGPQPSRDHFELWAVAGSRLSTADASMMAAVGARVRAPLSSGFGFTTGVQVASDFDSRWEVDLEPAGLAGRIDTGAGRVELAATTLARFEPSGVALGGRGRAAWLFPVGERVHLGPEIGVSVVRSVTANEPVLATIDAELVLAVAL